MQIPHRVGCISQLGFPKTCYLKILNTRVNVYSSKCTTLKEHINVNKQNYETK